MKTIEIFADTRGVARCTGRNCGARILWATVVKTGRKMCFSDPELPALKTRHDESMRLIEEVDLDQNHWADCPDARRFNAHRTQRGTLGERKRRPADPRNLPTIHECAVRTCGKKIPLERLMCPTHWYMVPADLQREVWKWYRLRGRDEDSRMKHLQACHDARVAVENKIAALF